ncbi:MAG: hypothetical protein HY775_11300 [Acidobacteria bacterium]|nr:hypothetical protein [Acidobacteriota bacterium]
MTRMRFPQGRGLHSRRSHRADAAAPPPQPPSPAGAGAPPALPAQAVAKKRGLLTPRTVIPALVAGLLASAAINIVPTFTARIEARRQFDALVRLGAEAPDPRPEEMLDWQRRLNSILARIDASRRVRRAFDGIVLAEFGSALAPPDEPVPVAAVRAAQDESGILQQMRAARAETARSGVWEFLKRVIERATEKAGGIGRALVREAVHGEFVRDPAGWESGSSPVRTAYELGDYRRAYAVSNPRSATDCPNGYLYTGDGCAADLRGTWKGRYRASLSLAGEDRTYTCDIQGPITLRVAQSGSSISGAFYLGGSIINFESCGALRDERFSFQNASVTGISVSHPSFQLVRTSQNWMGGVLHGKLGDVKFDVARPAS